MAADAEGGAGGGEAVAEREDVAGLDVGPLDGHRPDAEAGPPWDDAGVADWIGWITTRHRFGPTGSLEAVELERPGLPPR